MAKSKFNLTGLLNQRSMELAQEQAGAAEETKEAGRQEGRQEAGKNEVVMVDVEDLVPSKDNFYHVDGDLKRSIELVGVLQPLLVNKPENGKYKVIAGHRRRLAAMELVQEGKESFRFLPCVYKKEDVMAGNHYGKQVPGKDGLGENDGSGTSGRTGKGAEKGIQHRGQDP